MYASLLNWKLYFRIVEHRRCYRGFFYGIKYQYSKHDENSATTHFPVIITMLDFVCAFTVLRVAYHVMILDLVLSISACVWSPPAPPFAVSVTILFV
jgi:hypothetical protein